MAGFLRYAGLTLLVTLLCAPAAARADDPEGVPFFEQKIRPVLVKNCYKCHSSESKELKGHLLLETREGVLKGGDSGPAIVPGKPEESLLLQALRHDGLEMPPDGKLSAEAIADVERWIKMGAPDPRDGKGPPQRPAIDLAEGKKFWAFQPPRRHDLPKVKDESWPRSDIDRHILAAMEAQGLKPSRDAERVTLLRRATIDLVGLPPTPEEMDEFLNDSSPEAFAKVVDRLLMSPRFGERWGRHWLDVARYADSNGKDENLTFHEAFRYRDYVIDSLNRDKPFDRFVLEQLAGDLLPFERQAERDELLTATGLLVVGPKVLADRDFVKRRMDVIDEQVDTVGKALLGLTLGCARCHDHKFDPIPTADYYALAGIFASTRTLDGIKLGNNVVSGWMLRPIGEDGAERVTAQNEHKKKLAALTDQIKKLDAELKQQEDKATMRLPTKLVGVTVDDKEAKIVGTWKPSTYSKPYVGEGYIHDDKQAKGEKSATFTPKLPKEGNYEVFISYTASKGRSTNTPVTVRFADGEKTVEVNQEETPKLDGLFRSIGTFKFKAGSEGSVTIENKGTAGYVIVDAVRFIPAGALENEPEMAMGVPEEVKQKIAEAKANLKKLKEDEVALKAAAPPAPVLVMAVRDEEKVENCRINVRGNPHQLGDEIGRGFLSVASDEARLAMPADRSGRLELARWIASAENPLTARVIVNRVWQHLLGEGLVRTVDNLGAQGERPTHPELLDELALRFVEEGWSLKRLIREIMLSRVYQLSAEVDPAAQKVDAENRLLSHAHRRRVEAEVIRDTILFVSGRLDRSMGGPVVAHLGERAIDNDSKGGVPTDTNFRRSVYLPLIRNDVPQILEVFDFADPEVTTGRRDTTTVPTQALFLMNSPLVLDQAQAAAKRLLALEADDAGRVKDLYRRALARDPTSGEIEKALAFVGSFAAGGNAGGGEGVEKEKAEGNVEAWSALCMAVFGCTEFRFVE
ncbi:MAG: DUF1553 domain-containing protein [Planctomycetia bacterium]|nr:DUF1553 domain-containing protein [Planctomycetia bacterium]